MEPMPLSLLNKGSPYLNLQRENPLLDCPLSWQGIRATDREKQINTHYTHFTKYSVENSEATASVTFMRSMSEISYLEKIKLLIYLELKPKFLTMIVTLKCMELEKTSIKEFMSSERRVPVNSQNLVVSQCFISFSLLTWNERVLW